MQPQPLISISSTGSLPRADRFPYWADVVTQTFVPLECDAPDRMSFSGSIRHRQIGCVGIADVCASAQRARRTQATIAAAPHDDLIITLQVDGTCRAGQGSRGVELRPGDGVVVCAEEPYVFEFSAQFRQIVLKVPGSFLPNTHSGKARAFVLGSGPGRLLQRLALCMFDDPTALSGEEEIGVERAVAALLRSATAPVGHAADPSARYASARLFIGLNLADPALAPHAVADYLKLSPRSVARLFAERGTTVERTIWRERLEAARQELLDPRLRHRSITDIAFAWGFSDAAHFSRSFSKAYGVAPAQFRATNLSPGSTGPRR